jgi:stress response protein YsnF
MTKRKTIVAVYDSHSQAKDAVQALHNAGFTSDQISLVAANAGQPLETDEHHEGTKAGQGAVTGGVLGGIAGLLLGMAGMTLPGIGPVVAAGPLATALGGAAAGALAGGIIGGLIGLGIPETEAHMYAEGIRRGSTIVAVTVPAVRMEEAMAILDRFDPIDIDERAQTWRQEGWQQFDAHAEPLGPSIATRTQPVPVAETAVAHEAPVQGAREIRAGDKEVIPLTQEELLVGKREINKPVRVRSYVLTEPVEETVTLRQERVNIDRRPVDRRIEQQDAAFEERVVVLDEMTEQAVVGKQARVVEEVVVGKEASERTETVRDEIRRTEVDIDRDDDLVDGKVQPISRARKR